KQVSILRRSLRQIEPEVEQQRALQDELIGIPRTAQTKQQPLQREAHEQQLHVFLPLACHGAQAPPYLGWHVDYGLVDQNTSASTYGCITACTRHARAMRSSSSSVKRLARQPSRNASRATSRPTRLRNLKQ